eukprot:1850615-Amphidinium_carterae.1
MFAPNWVDHIKQHVVVNGFNKNPSETVTGYKVCYLHSTTSTLKRMSESQNFGSRFLFPSSLQCICHQAAHHHFQLSASQIKSDSLVLQLLVKQEFLDQNSTVATNGYSRSWNVTSLPFPELYVTGSIHIQETLANFL